MNRTTLGALALLLAIISAQPSGKAQQLNAQQSAPKPAPTLTPSTTGIIAGRVLDEASQPVPDAQVSLMVSGGPIGARRTATSDDEGKFNFNDLPQGRYSLAASVPGYVQQRNVGQFYRVGDTAILTLVKGGVITGRVTNDLGEPVVAVKVSAQLVRDAADRKVPDNVGLYTQPTDDRGVYRLYGLNTGTYLVLANAPERYISSVSAYQNETPTYHPSADRDGAQEVAVRLGDEASGIDIRYRGERGYQISGKVAGAIEAKTAASSSIEVSLKNVASEAVYTATSWRADGSVTDFTLYAIPNGEYELTARRREAQAHVALSAPRRVIVKNADVTGVSLTLLPLGSLAGRVVLANAAAEIKCTPTNPLSLEEVFLTVRRAEKGKTVSGQSELSSPAARLNAKGDFVLSGMAAGVYYPAFGAPNEHWYLRAVTLLPTAAAPPTRNTPSARETDLSRSGITLKAGEELTGITVSLALGAAALSGRLVSAAGNALPELTRVYLIPAEAAAADEVLRYAETVVNTVVNKEGRFGFGRHAPGRYRLYAEPVPPDEPRERRMSFAAWDQLERTKLRRLAEAAAQPEIELKACEQLKDYELRLETKK